MKKIALYALLVALFVGCTPQEERCTLASVETYTYDANKSLLAHLYEDKAYGNTLEERYDYEASSTTLSLYNNSVLSRYWKKWYNTQSAIVRNETYDANASLRSLELWTRDANNTLLLYTKESNLSDGNYSEAYTYLSNNLVETTVKKNGAFFSLMTSDYNGTLETNRSYFETNTTNLVWSKTYLYNESNATIRQNHYGASGALQEYFTVAYSVVDTLNQSVQEYYAPTLSTTTTLQKDANGNTRYLKIVEHATARTTEMFFTYVDTLLSQWYLTLNGTKERYATYTYTDQNLSTINTYECR
ncbi:MAG: hypothetical protein KU28_01370 [Sulfurovum sp. PC08-66]|nr:MAG: hypothetical protein KU28_01370 [Sulfurovum sp. PC08-66]KIM12599.1 MAG: hypothetical protein KU37_01485 [Sulfuricurvum sp. PC08-66]